MTCTLADGSFVGIGGGVVLSLGTVAPPVRFGHRRLEDFTSDL